MLDCNSQGSVSVWIETNLSLFGEAPFMASCLECYGVTLCHVTLNMTEDFHDQQNAYTQWSWPFHKITLRHSHNSRLNQWGRKLSKLEEEARSYLHSQLWADLVKSSPTSEWWFLWNKITPGGQVYGENRKVYVTGWLLLFITLLLQQHNTTFQ